MNAHNDTNQDIMQYLPLVEKAARNVNVKSYDYEHEDLVNIGFIGLMDAVEKFDESQNVPFENYAYIRIKGSIIDEIRKNSSVPRSQMDRLNQFYREKEQLEQEWKREPTEQEVVEKLGFTEKQVRSMHSTIHTLARVSLDEVLFDNEMHGSTRLDFIEDENQLLAEKKVLKSELKEVLQQAITKLTKREQTILQLIYDEELAMKDIAYIFDISTPRVSQIHGKILVDLRENIKQIMKEEADE